MVVVGSRGSGLALRQTGQVVDELLRLNPGMECRIQVIKTSGDAAADVPLYTIGDKGLFVKEIEVALLRGEIDFAVHSAKDLPSEMDPALTIAAYSEREDPADALVSKAGKLADLPAGATVGTSSVRRRAQILAARRDLHVIDLRGNLDTRLKKVDSAQYDAVILACAGLRRMGWEGRITEVLPYEICLPAAGQGAVAVQCREGDAIADMLQQLDHAPTRRCVSAERALLSGLGAGCQTPIAALARESSGEFRLDAVVARPDGSQVIRRSALGDAGSPEELGRRLAEELLNSPARQVLRELRQSAEPKMTGAA